mmetsp:Transcript_20180/g.39438  ORF Transcript_20180/g.39438 Transcript_20180/m.39438 type:complete len:200 (-) Transcript_20180:501-1100(-)
MTMRMAMVTTMTTQCAPPKSLSCLGSIHDDGKFELEVSPFPFPLHQPASRHPYSAQAAPVGVAVCGKSSTWGSHSRSAGRTHYHSQRWNLPFDCTLVSPMLATTIQFAVRPHGGPDLELDLSPRSPQRALAAAMPAIANQFAVWPPGQPAVELHFPTQPPWQAFLAEGRPSLALAVAGCRVQHWNHFHEHCWILPGRIE